ncbi:hypothetical protein CLUG_04722 [Clavispora lusitaniae ATCC 42720]|uniref:Uncharacterized protein n=1 Tax=Clavispora lusitaniae (strain ATCC 42720) TaxID=306902 RepID=C4Y945_CLAL4|nr:uncharacterized protein CLUG_04722 [Clavispora lusitaniae ATCC 42720]EEQ40594.1 hypothetical protein CLUG_04722 [Clavispora lusitaniae ATCC 42720]
MSPTLSIQGEMYMIPLILVSVESFSKLSKKAFNNFGDILFSFLAKKDDINITNAVVSTGYSTSCACDGLIPTSKSNREPIVANKLEAALLTSSSFSNKPWKTILRSLPYNWESSSSEFWVSTISRAGFEFLNIEKYKKRRTSCSCGEDITIS